MIKKIEHFGDQLVEVFHLVGLFIIGAAVTWASWVEVFTIIEHGGPKIKDILLLFIYLELGAMIGIYFKTKRLPVRFLIYIAITALTRVLAVDVKVMDNWHMVTVTGCILVLSIAVLALRYGSTHLHDDSEQNKLDDDKSS